MNNSETRVIYSTTYIAMCSTWRGGNQEVWNLSIAPFNVADWNCSTYTMQRVEVDISCLSVSIMRTSYSKLGRIFK